MAFKHVLKATLDPAISLVEMNIWNDTSVESSEKQGAILTPKFDPNNKETTGKAEPHLAINDFDIMEENIIEMIIDETGFVPTISLIFDAAGGEFSPVQFPRANPILSLYIKSPHEKLKPIRNDYIITSIRGSDTLILKGELFIPKLYDNISASYDGAASKEALKSVCKDVKLGFQSNETSPSDGMNWINPNSNSYDFMKHIISHAYQNDDSFFDGFIDKYYYLNYINVNLQIEQDGEFDNTVFAGKTDLNLTEDIQNDSSKKLDSTPMGLVEHPRMTNYSGAIIEKNLITNEGEILINEGFKKRIYYYDSGKSDFISFYVQPIVSTHTADKQKSLEPTNETLKTNETKKWINIQYGNTHPNYNAAKLINHHNLEELDKIQLKATVTGINFNMARGQRIPVGIYDVGSEAMSSRAWDGNQWNENRNQLKMDDLVFNEWWSGIYYLAGNRYIYDSDTGFKTEHILSKRDWKPNPKK